MGGADRDTEMRSTEDDHGGRGLGSEPMYWFKFDHFCAHSADNPQPAPHGTKTHGHSATKDNPERHFKGRQGMEAYQGQSDDPHGFLGIISAMAQGHDP